MCLCVCVVCGRRGGGGAHSLVAQKTKLLIALKKLGTRLSVRLCLVHCFILFSKANTVLFSPQILKKICNHPLLLTKKAAEDILEGMDEMVDDQDIGMVRKLVMNLEDMVHDDDALEVGQDVSCKLSFIMTLLVSIVGRMPIFVVTYIFGPNVKFK